MRFYFLAAVLILVFLFSCRKSDYFIENESVVSDLGGGTGTVTWGSDKSYLIDGFVFVNDGQTLTIEAGTKYGLKQVREVRQVRLLLPGAAP